MASVAEILTKYESTEDVAEAAQALDLLVEMGAPTDLPVGDCYDELATGAAESDDYALAVRMERRALEHGCDRPDIAEDMLAWYLLKAGRREEGEAEFARLREERAGNPEIIHTLANARMDAGDGPGAVSAYEEALDLARSIDDPAWVDQLREERADCRREQGLPPDEEDLLAGTASSGRPVATHFSLAWFPRDQIEAALARWPSLAGDLSDPDAYCRTIEMRLRETQSATGIHPSVAPLHVERLVEFAAQNDLDPDSGEARSRFAAQVGAGEESVPWPPGRNDACWCGSGRKYKRCCG